VDLGPARLDTLVQAFAARAESVLRADLDVSFGDAVRHAEPGVLGSERVWQSEVDAATVWCALDAAAHRTFLEWILDGPGAPAPTAAERMIVSECIDRLLCGSAEMRWSESTAALRLECDVWLRIIDVGGQGSSATIRLFTAANAQVRVAPALVLDDVPLDVGALLQPFPARLGALARWEPGIIIRLADSSTDVAVQLRVGDGPSLSGTLGRVNGWRAIRLDGSAARERPV
jgi:hypothetical protein